MTALSHRLGPADRQAFLLLRTALVLAPILLGIDKFFNWTVEWTDYLAPWINDIVPGSAQELMYAVGVVEIIAGLLVAVVPRIGAPIVAAWLAGIVIDLLSVDPPTYYDIALRDFGLFIAALALTRLAWSSARRAPSAEAEAPANRPVGDLVGSR